MAAIGSVGIHGHSTEALQPKLVAAAHEFEAQLMKELLRPMTSSMSADEDESEAQGGSILGSFATEALGKALSNNGGLGIATSILGTFSRNGTDSHAGKGAAGSQKLQTIGSSRSPGCR
jgi:Rod binding domain-containing protein